MGALRQDAQSRVQQPERRMGILSANPQQAVQHIVPAPTPQSDAKLS